MSATAQTASGGTTGNAATQQTANAATNATQTAAQAAATSAATASAAATATLAAAASQSAAANGSTAQASTANAPAGNPDSARTQSNTGKAAPATVNAATTVTTGPVNPTATNATGYAAQLASQQGGAPNDNPPSDPRADGANPAGDTTPATSDKQDSGSTADANAVTAAPSDAKTNMAAALPPTPVIVPQTTQAQAAAAPSAASMSPATVSAVIQQITVHMSTAAVNGVDHINVQLNPPELGHVEVRMEVGPSGHFSAVFAADRPQTVDMLQRNAHELTRSLQDAGVRTDAGSLSFNLRGQNQQNSAFNNFSNARAPSPSWNDTPAETSPVPAAVYSNSSVGTGRVDIRV